MGKENNLTDFLTDVADAIREKKGTTAKINPQNFSSEILSIEGGEGGQRVEALTNDVNFYDYDGFLLYSYSKEDFLKLNSMPALPEQKGLICQGWNYTLEDAQDCVNVSGALEIGAMYITDDGKTRLYIRIEDRAAMDITLYFVQNVSSGVTIDWGDRLDKSFATGTGNKSVTHIYQAPGNYVITLEVKSGCTLTLGQSNSSYSLVGGAGTKYRYMTSRLTKVEIGSGVTQIGGYAFTQCHSLKTITIPNAVTTIGNYALNYNYQLQHITIPINVSSIGTYCFQYDYGLKSVSLPKVVDNIGTYAFAYCGSLRRFTMPYTLSTMGQYICAYAYALAMVTLPTEVTDLPTYVFRNAGSMTYVKIPAAFASIGNYAFNQCYSLKVVDFRDHTVVSTISNTNSFTNTASNCQFVVPDELYDAWTTANVWSNLASKIVRASEFVD